MGKKMLMAYIKKSLKNSRGPLKDLLFVINEQILLLGQKLKKTDFLLKFGIFGGHSSPQSYNILVLTLKIQLFSSNFSSIFVEQHSNNEWETGEPKHLP